MQACGPSAVPLLHALLPPPQVATADGAAVITIEQLAQNATALNQQPDGVVWAKNSSYASSFVDGWNKFCFTGGYMEARLQLPGDHFASGLWCARCYR